MSFVDPRKIPTLDRRAVVGLGLGAVVLACTHGRGAKGAHEEKPEGEEVGPTEDLMREHGVLRRILLVYEEGARRLESGASAEATSAIGKGADIVRAFVEDYHEKQEEEDLFPRFEKAKKLVDLVATLRLQHEKGRQLTDAIRADVNTDGAEARKRVVDAIRAFSHMYRAHAAREDTVLFASLRAIVSPHEMDEIGERFEDREHALFGKEGFESMVQRVAALEASLGIDRLESFTPS